MAAASPVAAQNWSTVGTSTGVGLRVRPAIDNRASLDTQMPWRGLHLSGFSGSFLPRRYSKWTHSVELDTSGTYLVARESWLGDPIRPVHYIDLPTFLETHAAARRREQWRTQAGENFRVVGRANRGPGGLNIEIPVEIKSKAFQKIFGGDRVGLNVQGEIRIDGGFRNEKRSEVRSSIAQGTNTNFKMNQTQRFTVTGKIGEKVTVNVDQDSERQLDFENNLKLNYRGFEDEIIQSIEAGNISLSLPATRFVTFSGRSTGLFGVKMDMQLGNLHLTTIASQEKGESQKLRVDGGATSDSRQIKDYEYKRYTYFFLDRFFREQYRQYTRRWQHIFDPSRAISRIKVYKSKPGFTENPDAIPGFALPDPENRSDTTRVGETKEFYRGHFLELEPDRDYFLENNLGYIVMNQPLTDDEVLAVAYLDSSGGIDGDIDFDALTQSQIFLKIIKAQNPLPGYRTWDLEWKNVYNLASRNLEREGFELRIFRKADGSGTDQESLGSKTYLEIFGLDTRDLSGSPAPDGKLDDDPNIINWARGELILPFLRPFARDTVFVQDQGGQVFTTHFDEAGSPDLAEYNRLAVIYDTTNTSTRVKTQESTFYLDVKSSSRSTSYSLGFNIIEGSEEVILNGDVLERGRQYTIDYWSGSLTILDERASQQNSQIDITYERNQLFQLQKKTILGSRAEYRLGENSFIGGTLLYLNERTLDQKVRVGSGPMRNVIWDLNTSLKFKPNFLTSMVDALPLVRATQESRLNFEGEIAQIIPNPNTLNNNSTGDRNGVAYIDDFEGAKRTTPLGIQRRGWTLASAPDQFLRPLYEASSQDRGNLNWYNPFAGVFIKDITPNRDINAQTAQTQDVLTLVFQPETRSGAETKRSWGGIMRALSPGFYDQTESKFLEVMVNGDVGVLHIDLGQISEDVIPNKKFDTEDLERGGIREGLLSEEEDVGLDGMANEDPRATAAGGDFWDINSNGIRDAFEPFSRDDWNYVSGSIDYDRINGTERNANDGVRIPDTEDLNGNGATDLVNNYFEFKFDLDKSPTNPDRRFIAGGEGLPPEKDKGWRLYRIPLNEPSNVVGTPSLSLIENARIWVDGADSEILVSIAEINLVGNEWRERREDPKDARLAVAVVNTHDNPEYVPPPGVEGEIDRITRVQAREQALVLKIDDLEPDSLVLAEKSFFDAQNYIHYKRMRMFVYAKDSLGNHIEPTMVSEEDSSRSDIVFFLRFGSNENNYYEIRERVFGGEMPGLGAWDPKNEIDIDLAELTNLKFDEDFIRYRSGEDTARVNDFFEKRISSTKAYRIKGEPSITNVRVLFAGVENLGEKPDPGNPGNFTGEIWINELRLSDIEKEKGVAMRARFDLAMSDFISINGEVNRQDADFHNVGTRFGSGDNRVSGSVNGNITLGKLLPASWGLSLPLTMNYSRAEATPKYVPGKDILITGDTPQEQLELAQTINETRGFSLSFNKSTKSKNFLIKNTIDNLRASVSQTQSEQSNPNILRASRVAWSGNVDYNLNFGRDTFFQPLKVFQSVPVLSKLAETRLYYLPRSFSSRLQGQNSNTSQITRAGATTSNRVYDLTRSYSTNYKIFESFSTSFSRAWTGDFREEGWQGLFSGNFEDLNKTQNFKVDYAPQVFGWLVNRMSYTSNYRFTNNITQGDQGRGAGTNTSLNANMTFRVGQLLKGSSRSSSRRTARPGRRRTRPGQGGRTGEAAEGEKKEGEEEDGGRKVDPLWLFKGIGKFLSNLSDINVTYAKRNNFSNFGLQEGNPRFVYQVGLSEDPGLGIVEGISTNTFRQNRSESFGVSSGIQLSRNVDIKIRYSVDQQSNRTAQVTGNLDKSWLRLGDGVSIPFPEWTVNISGLEKLKLLSKVATSVSLSHNFTGKKSLVWKNEEDQVTREDFNISFRPLLKASLSLKNGMILNFQMDRNTGYNNTFNPVVLNDILELNQVGGQKTTQQDMRITANYSKKSGFKIPLPFLKNKELKNSVDFSFSFIMSKNRTESVRGASNDFQISNERESWTLEPRVTYSFSNRVRGGSHFQIGKTKSTLAGEVSIKEFGIDVNISIRGN